MALNDTLTHEEATLWWITEVQIQSKRDRRDIESKDERVEETNG